MNNIPDNVSDRYKTSFIYRSFVVYCVECASLGFEPETMAATVAQREGCSATELLSDINALIAQSQSQAVA